jgi:hypothetical protein
VRLDAQDSDVISHRGHARLSRTVGATVEGAIGLDPVAHDLAAAVLTDGSEVVDGALKAVEGMGMSAGHDLERAIVVVAADLTASHAASWKRDSTTLSI